VFACPNRLVVKLANISGFSHALTDMVLCRDQARRDILNEAKILTGPLKSLQGRVVPYFDGLMGSIQSRADSTDTYEEIWCAVHQDAGGVLDTKYKLVPAVR